MAPTTNEVYPGHCMLICVSTEIPAGFSCFYLLQKCLQPGQSSGESLDGQYIKDKPLSLFSTIVDRRQVLILLRVLKDLSVLAEVTGIVKRTVTALWMLGYNSGLACLSVSISVLSFSVTFCHLHFHLTISALQAVKLLSGRSPANGIKT